MNKYSINTVLRDTRNNKTAMVEAVLHTDKGVLYTVKFEHGPYKRYYEEKLLKVFRLAIADYSNVVFYDFKNKTQFANYESWLAWAEQQKAS